LNKNSSIPFKEVITTLFSSQRDDISEALDAIEAKDRMLFSEAVREYMASQSTDEQERAIHILQERAGAS